MTRCQCRHIIPQLHPAPRTPARPYIRLDNEILSSIARKLSRIMDSVSLATLRLQECDAQQPAEFQLPECRAISAPQLMMDVFVTKSGKAGQLVGGFAEDPVTPCTPSPSYGSLLKRTLKGTNATKRKFYDSGEAMLLQQGRPLDDTVASGLTLDQLQSLPKVYRTRFA